MYAAEQDGASATAERLASQIGVTPVAGGVHPRFGTRNVIFPLAQGRYLEVVEVLADRHLLLVKGSVPGAKNGLLTVRRAVKAGK